MKWLLHSVYGLIVGVGFIAMYTLLNAGHPQSLLRIIIPDPRHDVIVALISSLTVFVLGFVVFYTRDRADYQHFIRLNRDRIRSMRQRDISDEVIAESILAALGTGQGYRYYLARRKLIAYLAEFE